MSEILERAKKYSAEIQKRTREEQLAWFGEQFDIPPEPLLRLVGYSPKSVRAKLASGATVVELARNKPKGTLRMTEIFRELVSRCGYDVKRVAKTFRHAPKKKPFGEVLESDSQVDIPRHVGKLAKRVAAGGPAVYRDLTRYLQYVRAIGDRV